MMHWVGPRARGAERTDARVGRGGWHAQMRVPAEELVAERCGGLEFGELLDEPQAAAIYFETFEACNMKIHYS